MTHDEMQRLIDRLTRIHKENPWHVRENLWAFIEELEEKLKQGWATRGGGICFMGGVVHRLMI